MVAKRIGLDLDGVVVDWQTKVLKMLNKRGKYNFDPNFQSPYWDWIEDNVTPEDWKWLWSDGMVESYMDALPYPGAIEFSRALRKLGDVVIITSRPEGSWTATIEWWKTYMLYTPSGYNFFRDGKEKHNVKADVYIDDNIENVLHLWYNNKTKVLLFDRPWNQGVFPEAMRVRSYEEALKEIARS